MKIQIIKNLFSNYLVSSLQMILGVLVVPFLIIKLGKEAFGLIVLVESTIALFEVMIGSVRIALSRHATYALAKGDLDEFTKYLSTGKYILYVIGSIVLLLGVIVSCFFSNIFKVPLDLIYPSKIMFLLVVSSFFITIPNVVYWSILYSKQRFDMLNFASSIGLIFRAVCIFVLFSILPLKYISLVTYGLIYLLMKITENTLIYIWHKKVMPGIHLTLKYFQSDKVREIISFSGYTSLSTVSALLYENTANILINVFYGPLYNAIYAVSLKIPMTINNIFLRATWSLAPTVTDLVAKNDKDRLEKLFFIYSKMICIVTLPMILFIMVVSKKIIVLWVGKDFSQSAGLLLIHLIPIMMILPLSVISLAINAYAKVKIPSMVTASIAVVNVILGILLAKFLGLKLYGFAISAALCTIINSAVFAPYYSCKISGMHFSKYVLNAFLKPLFLGCLVILPLYFIINFMSHNLNLSMLLVQSIFISIVYYCIAYFCLINKYEKDLIISFITKSS